ncbi:hypothetical protein ACFL4L_01670 [bacterium]
MKKVITIISVLLIIIGCSPKKESPQIDNSQISPGEEITNVSFIKDIQPIFNRSCAVCHNRKSGNKSAIEDGIYFEKKEDVLGMIGSFIQLDNPEESSLINVLNQSSPVSKRKIVMPPPNSNVPKWSDDEIELFSLWIKQGAKDN